MSYQLIDTVTPDVGAKTGAEKINNNAVQAQYQGGYFTATGTANAITLTSGTGAPTAYTAGQEVCFRANATNTGAATVNVDGLGIKSIKTESGADIPARYLSTSADTRLRYDGVNFIANIPARVVLAATGRNLIINGDFSVWQRGVSQTSNGYGSDDKWRNDHAGTTKTHSRQTFTVGQTAVPNNPKYFSRTVVTSVAGASNLCIKYSKLEDVRRSSGQEVTLSFYAKADSNKNMAVDFEQFFGTGGSPSANVNGIGVTTVPLTTSWQRFTITTTLPSISGKTLGTDGNDGFWPIFWFDAGSNFDARTNSLGQQSGTFDIANVQLEFGDTATDFEYVSSADQWARCQRYFERLHFASSQNATVAQALSTTTSLGSIAFTTKKRAAPSISVNNPGNWAMVSATGTILPLTNLSIGATSVNLLEFTSTVASGLVSGNASILIPTTGSETIDVDAEL